MNEQRYAMSIRIPLETKDAIERLAQKSGLTKAEISRLAVNAGLDYVANINEKKPEKMPLNEAVSIDGWCGMEAIS